MITHMQPSQHTMSAFQTTFLPSFRTSYPHLSPRSQPRHVSIHIAKASLSNILIVGANHGLGLDLACQLTDKSKTLTTTYRTFCPPTLAAISTVHCLDAIDKPTVDSLITNVKPHTIISCIGGNVERAEYPDFQGNRNLIDAALEAGVKRFVMISALGAGDSESSVPFQVMDTMRDLLMEKSHAEVYLRKQPIEWVVIRPGPLTDGEPSGNAVATEGTKCYGTVSRKDLAILLVEVANSDKAANKTLHVVDTKNVLITSPYVRPLEFWEPLPFEEFIL